MAINLEQFPPKLDKKGKICWLICVLIPVVVLLIPLNEVFIAPIRNFFAITLFFILVVAFELLDSYIPALFLPAAYIVTRTAIPNVALAPWLNELPWVMIGAFLLVNVVEKTGLLKRVAYWIIVKTGGSYNGILYGILIAGIVLNIMLPGGVVVPLIAIAYGICVALNLGKSKTSAGIMLAGGVAAIMPTMFLYAPAYFGLCFNAAKTAVPDMDVSFLKFSFDNIIYMVFCFILVFVISKMFKPDREFQGKDYFKGAYHDLGKVAKVEKKAMLIIACLVLYLVTMGMHKLGMGWGFVLASCAMYAPGINLGTRSDIKNINMSVVLFAGSCLSIGTVATSLGIGAIMADAVLPFLSGSGEVRLLSTVMVITFVLNFIMTPSAIMAVLAGPLAQIAVDLGVNPLPVLYALNSSAYQIMLPYEHTSFLILYSFGMISSRDFMKFFGVTALLHFIFVICMVLPYWKIIGLL